jgi:hypothetical protein
MVLEVRVLEVGWILHRVQAPGQALVTYCNHCNAMMQFCAVALTGQPRGVNQVLV